MKTRRLFRIFFLVLAAVWLASCAPAAAPTSEKTEPAAPAAPQATQAPAVTAAPAAAQPQAPAATAAPTQLMPLTPTPAAAQPQATTSPAVIENRLVELEWPSQLRLGDSDIIRLALVPYQAGYIVEAEFPEHQVQSQPVPVEQLAGYRLAAAARLDGIGFEIAPTGDQQQFLPVNQPATWRWTLQPRSPGQHRLVVMVTLLWIPESGPSTAPRQALLFSKGVDVKVTSFLGMTRGQAATSGFFGLFFGSGLGLFALIYRAKPRPSRLKILAPDQHLTIETSPGLQIQPADAKLLNVLFQRHARLALIQKFLSGYSGARTFLALPTRPNGQVDAYTIVKIGARPDIQREFENYETYVRDSLPPLTARIQQPPVSIRGSQTAALQYTFVAAPDHMPVSLRLSLLEHPDPALLHRLFDCFGPYWWLQRQPYVFRLGEEYDRLLPPHYVIQPTPRDGRGLPSSRDDRALFPLEESLTPGSLNLEPGKGVRVARFSNTELREDGRSQTLTGVLSPGQPPLRLRWLSPNPPNRSAGQVLNTRAGLLAEYTHTFERFGLPDPLLRLEALLNETILGSRSIIHGDLNLENILVGPGEFVWLIDFAQTRPGHPLFDFSRLSAEIIAHVLARKVDSPRQYLDRLRSGDPLLQTTAEIAQSCLFNPAVPREYNLALYAACLGGVKFSNLDPHQKHCLYLTAAFLCQDL